MRALWQDVRYALRMMARSPGFAVLVVVILTIAIGANTAVFSVIHTALLNALPYDAPGRIVEIEERDPNLRMFPRPTSAPTLVYWREHNQVFDYLAGREYREMSIAGFGEPFPVYGYAISSCFFSLLGVQPALGRTFVPEEEQPGRHHVAIVSHAFWQEHLGADPQALGKTITADGEEYTVVGIMPAGYRDTPSQPAAALWVPLVPDFVQADSHVGVWARLKRRVRVEQARAEMAVLEQQLTQADPRTYGGFVVAVERVVDRWFEPERKLLYPLWGAVALVLLIACLNVAGLFLVHGNARRQEMAMRATLGASRGRLLAQLLVESLLLSLAGGLFGILAATWMIKGIIAVCPADVTPLRPTRIDRTVLLFTLVLSLLVGLAFGLLPAWKAAGVRLVHAARGESSGPVLDRGWRRLSNGLVVAQIAVALTLLIGVAMLTQSLILLQKEDLGFRPENIVVMSVEFPTAKYPEGPQAAVIARQILQRAQSMPGVRSAALFCPSLRFGSGGAFTGLDIVGRPREKGPPTFARYQIVSPNSFAVLGMRILKGRGFTEKDMEGTGKAAIIDENLARRFFPNQDPIGQRLGWIGDAELPIVGIVSSLRDYRVMNPDIVSVYLPLSEQFWTCTDVVLKADGDPMHLAPTLRALALDLDKDLEVTSIETIGETLSLMLAPRRFAIVLLGAFAQIALVVAALGLYGLLQYGVSRRTHEIGVRMALGATRGRIVQTVLRQGGLLVLVGIGLGLIGGYAMSRIVASLLYESKPTDPGMLAVVLIVLLAAAFTACYLPARRAAKVDPMVALRYE